MTGSTQIYCLEYSQRDKLIHHTTAPTGLTNRSINFLVAVSEEASSLLELVDFVVGSLVFGAVGLYVGMRDLESFQLLASRLNFGQSRKLAHIHFESGRVVNLEDEIGDDSHRLGIAKKLKIAFHRFSYRWGRGAKGQRPRIEKL